MALAKSVVRAMCRNRLALLCTLGTYVFEALFCFSRLMEWEPNVMHNTIMKDVQLVYNGGENRVFDLIMQWVENVCLRALQDLALHHP